MVRRPPGPCRGQPAVCGQEQGRGRHALGSLRFLRGRFLPAGHLSTADVQMPIKHGVSDHNLKTETGGVSQAPWKLKERGAVAVTPPEGSLKRAAHRASRLWQGEGGAVSDRSFLFPLGTSCFLIDSETSAYPVVLSGKRKRF